MELVTGRKGEAHVTSQQDRMLHQGVFGTEAYILNTGKKLKPEVQSSNEIRIRDGALMVQGALSCVKINTYDSITIQNGTQGMKRIDLIVWQYMYNAESDTEYSEWNVIQGMPDENEPHVPEYVQGDIQIGDNFVQVPYLAVHLDGINITEVEMLLEVIPDIYTTNKSLTESITELNRKLPELVVASSSTISYTPDRDCKVLVTYEVCGWGFGGTTWQIEITGSASSGDSPIRADMKRGVFDGTDGIYKDVSTSAYFIGLRAGVTYTFNRVSYAGSGGKEANPFMKLLAV
jgi:hypothetical protein